VEGLIRDLENAMDVDGGGAGSPAAAPGPGKSIFGAFFTRKPPAAAAAAAPARVDLMQYIIRPAEFNPSIPANLYLVPSAGAVSWCGPLSSVPLNWSCLVADYARHVG